MYVSLLFPPGTDPRNPHLAIPSLAAVLRRAGVRTSVRDLDLEALLFLIEPTRVADAARTCRLRLGSDAKSPDSSLIRKLLAHETYIVDNIGRAPHTLRHPDAFYQPHQFHSARECIVRALEIISAANGCARYSIAPVSYEVNGVDPTRLRDLALVTADAHANLFDEFYRKSVLQDFEHDRPDVVGISILNHQQLIPGLILSRTLKSRGYFVVIGGTVFVKFTEALLRCPQFFELFCNGLIAYEGETAFLELLDQLDGSRDLGAVPNLLHLDSQGRLAIGRLYVEDVNALPTPDFDGLSLDQYLAPAPVLPILTGKGCYFNRCKFCDIPFVNHISPKAYRWRKPELVAADIATLQRRHGARHFEITDEALSPRLLLKIADALSEHPEVDARFVGFARLEPGFSPEVCRRIHAMGVRKLYFGLESGSQTTLDHMDKGIRVEDAPVVLSNCADAGIAFHIFSIVGFPEETETNSRETLDFFLDNASVIGHARNSFDIHSFTLDLRTDYMANASALGLEFDEDDLATREFPIMVDQWINTRGMDQDTAVRLAEEYSQELKRAFRDFHSPFHVWPDFSAYALLYADHYDGKLFPFRCSLPRSGDPLRFRLVWTESVRIDPVENGYQVCCLTGDATIGPLALALLAKPTGLMEVDQLIASLLLQLGPPTSSNSALESELRAVIDGLLTVGALRLEPAQERSASEDRLSARQSLEAVTVS
jgi:anaerobic magnesium-protoporphyrin IX monomethyl ester cyclase